jgi:hypothetical protein
MFVKSHASLVATLLAVAIAPIVAQSNTVAGKIVDSVTQQGLAGVQVTFHAVKLPTNVFETVNSDVSGRYQTDKISRQTTRFAVQYAKMNYVDDGRETVENDVYNKELDSLALVSINAAKTSERAMTAALEALGRFVTVSGNASRAQSTLDALRLGDDGRLVMTVLTKNPQVAGALTRSGVR